MQEGLAEESAKDIMAMKPGGGGFLKMEAALEAFKSFDDTSRELSMTARWTNTPLAPLRRS